MNYFDHFFDHQAEGLGYGQFTAQHFILLGLSILFIAAIARAYRKSEGGGRLTIRRSIAVILIVSEILKFIAMAIVGSDISNYLPLEICSFAMYTIVMDAIWPENKFFPQMLLTIFMPGAVMALIFPTTTILPAFNYFSIHQFFFHALIVAYVISRFVCGEIETNYPGVWKSVAKTIVLAAAIYLVDYVFDRNFMFLRDTEDNAMLEIIQGVTGEGIPYTLGLVVFAIIMLHVFYFLFKAIEKMMIRRANI